jgi:hypothetical protein
VIGFFERPYLENRLEKEDGKGERNASVASAVGLAVARGAGAAHAEEGLSNRRENKRASGKVQYDVNLKAACVFVLALCVCSQPTWPVLAPKAEGPGRLKLAGTPENPTVAPAAAAAGAGAAAFLGAGAAAATGVATDGLCGLGCSQEKSQQEIARPKFFDDVSPERFQYPTAPCWLPACSSSRGEPVKCEIQICKSSTLRKKCAENTVYWNIAYLARIRRGGLAHAH